MAMRFPARVPMLALSLTVVAVVLAGCSAPPPSPGLLARCLRDQALWQRYNASQPGGPTWERLYVEYAVSRCRVGDYHPAIETIEDILRQTRVDVPG
jgi:hypothetical protein